MTSPIPPIPTGLPTAAYITQRLGASGVGPNTEQYYSNLVPLVLAELAARIECPMPQSTQTEEPVYCSGRLPRIVPKFWPITAVSEVKLGDGTPLPLGTPFQVAQGTNGAAVAIETQNAISGQYLMTGCKWQGLIFVSYTAGFNALPPDLLEVFFEWARLMGLEKDREGLTDVSVDQLKVQAFVRKLPDWALRTIHDYDRMTAYA